MSQAASELEIPGYRVIRELGKGGAARVYLAKHQRLDIEVALKVMSPALAVDEDYNKRFVREGQTIAKLNHPGIIKVYDIDVVSFRPYIAMEYLPRGSLKERMDEPLSPRKAVHILSEVADALAYAHKEGLIHRDVKPENILFNAKESPILTDFGIAKYESSDTALTSVGIVVGTPRYISPEQAQGLGCDARTDIYALGIMLYEMLIGSPPYNAKGSMSLLYAHIHDPIPKLPPSLSRFQNLLESLLAKEPQDRLESCSLLVQRLRELSDQTKVALSVGKMDVSEARASRRRKVKSSSRFWLGTAVTCLGMILIGWLVLFQLNSSRSLEQATISDFKGMISRLLEPSNEHAKKEQTVNEKSVVDRTKIVEDGNSIPTHVDAIQAFATAEAYYYGSGVSEDKTAAISWYQKAAEQGHSIAQYYLGVAYGNGVGVEQDDDKAIHWLYQAAHQGEKGAGYNLILAKLFGSDLDYETAAKFAKQLAEEKYSPVYRILGWMYNTGTGVKSSLVQSVRWGTKSMVGEDAGELNTLPRVVFQWQNRLESELRRVSSRRIDKPT